jgi:hypothetical protein
LQNFRTIGQGVFVGWVPEYGMFPLDSEVVLNTVLSANALHVMLQSELRNFARNWDYFVATLEE